MIAVALLPSPRAGGAETSMRILSPLGLTPASRNSSLADRQMGREDEQAFHQGDQQDGNNDRRNHQDKLTHDAAGKKQWQKSRHRGEDGENDRLGDLGRTIDRSLQVWLAGLAVFINILTDDNRIINHDSERHNEGKQRNHID